MLDNALTFTLIVYIIWLVLEFIGIVNDKGEME